MKFNNIQDVERFISELGSVINETLEETFGQQCGFALLLFDFYKTGIGNYISNADRTTMVKALRETADRIENREDIPPTIGGIQ